MWSGVGWGGGSGLEQGRWWGVGWGGVGWRGVELSEAFENKE